MTNKGKGWHNHRPQHILASHGIPTKAKAKEINEENIDINVSNPNLETIRNKETPTVEDFLNSELEFIKWGYPAVTLRNQNGMRITKSSPIRSFVHETGHKNYFRMIVGSELKDDWDDMYEKSKEWYDNLDHMEEYDYWEPAQSESRYPKVRSIMEDFAGAFTTWFSPTPEDDSHYSPEQLPLHYQKFFYEVYGKPRDMKIPKEVLEMVNDE